MIPYFIYGLLILAVLSFYKDYDIFIAIGDLLYGGARAWRSTRSLLVYNCLITYSTVIWYYQWIKKSTQLVLVLLLFFIGHIPLLSNYNFLWNADVVLVSLFYYSMGYFSKNFILKYSNSILLVLLSASLSITFVLLNVSGNIDYYMNMKMSRFNNVILDIIIPFSFFIPIIFVSQLISHISARTLFEFIGKYSIVIMYLHLPINILINEIFAVSLTPLNFTLAGVLIPVLIGYTFSKFSFTRKVMLGRS